MRKFNFVLCALAMSVTAAHAAINQDGEVNFNGKLIDDTCQVDPASKKIDVTLPTMSTTKLKALGDQVGSTSFDIKVVDCPAGITKVGAHFEANGSSGMNPATGNLVNSATTGAATKVEVALYNPDGTQIKVGQTGSKVDVGNAGTAKQATLTYSGGYYATGQTTPGAVTAKVMYTLAYN